MKFEPCTFCRRYGDEKIDAKVVGYHTYESGKLKATGAYAHMEKRVSRYLRYALFGAAKFVSHWEPSFAAYLAKKRAEGKHYNVAISYDAMKLVRLIFVLQTFGKAFQPAQHLSQCVLRGRSAFCTFLPYTPIHSFYYLRH